MTRPMPAALLAGQPVTRVDGRRKVTGQAMYAADNPVPNLAYAALVCSTVARGTVERIDSAAAQRVPDVLRVITDFGGVTLPFDPRQVASFGQPVAVVVASTLEAATHGASLVEVRYSGEQLLTDMDSPHAVEEPGKTGRVHEHARGNADDALRGAAVVSDLRYTIARNNHNPIELAATVANWEGDRLTVWDKVQGITWALEAYSEAFGIPADQIRVISPFVGGGFGIAGKIWPHQLLAAFAARQLRRPVKLVLSRKQFYTVAGYRPTSRQRLAIGADRSGRIGVIIHEGRTENSRYEGFEDNIVGPAQFMYSSPNMRSVYRSVPLDINPPTFMRGPGTTTGAFALECGMDDLAVRLGIDPIELRLRNEPDRDESEGLPFSTRRLTDCFRQGAATFGWSRRNPTPRASRDGNQLIGIGTAASVYHALRGPCAVSARVNADGTADVGTATIDMGPGTYTSMTQVAADTLGVPIARVRFTLGDSRLPEAPVHGGSRTMASVGSAVAHVGAILRDRFIRTAVVDGGSPLNGLRPEDVAVADGRMFSRGEPARGESYQDLLRRRGWGSLDVQETWSPDDADQRFSMHAYGAIFAEVAVDELLGSVRVRRVYGCYDAGRIINPKLAHSQAIGGMVGGIGMALLEGTHLDHRDGRIVNANMSDYLVPVNADVPALDAEFLPAEDTVANPLGVKGLGELVMVGVPAAIANAVFNATGKRITDLPITLERLL
jgi:xanthine dehydrogenase YagR molybdenum-binding subunit